MARKVKYIVTTMHDPFPVFFAHVDYPENSRKETARGPFYAANSKTYDYASPENIRFANWRAEGLRAKGWNVSVTEEIR